MNPGGTPCRICFRDKRPQYPAIIQRVPSVKEEFTSASATSELCGYLEAFEATSRRDPARRVGGEEGVSINIYEDIRKVKRNPIIEDFRSASIIPAVIAVAALTLRY